MIASILDQWLSRALEHMKKVLASAYRDSHVGDYATLDLIWRNRHVADHRNRRKGKLCRRERRIGVSKKRSDLDWTLQHPRVSSRATITPTATGKR